jgi:hypothetical protein
VNLVLPLVRSGRFRAMFGMNSNEIPNNFQRDAVSIATSKTAGDFGVGLSTLNKRGLKASA